jgi:hypothetical protein
MIVDFLMMIARFEDDYYYSSTGRDSMRAIAIQTLEEIKRDDPDLYQELYMVATLEGLVYHSEYNNSGTGYAQGIEYFLRYDPADWWSGWISITLSRSMRTRKKGYKAHPFPLDRPLLISLVNYYRLPREYELGVKFRYMSGKPYTFLNFGDYLEIGPYNEKRFAPYIRFDFRISKSFTFFGHKSHWYTELWNAFNTPNCFLRDNRTGDIKNINLNLPVPALFMGLDFQW